MAVSLANLRVLLVTALICAVPDAHAVLPDSRDPIALDADSSEFDRQTGALLFRNVSIRQGTLAIAADTARVDDLDFADSSWDFNGQVRIDGEASHIRSETAVLKFRDHRLIQAAAQGRPATFEREKTDEFRALSGSAETIDYDLAGGILTLKGNATLVDGNNEINGAVLRYELASQKLIASSEGGGDTRVRITVTPETLGIGEPDPERKEQQKNDSARPSPDGGQ
jgi:lipopolysaccharide export system protein LptA